MLSRRLGERLNFYNPFLRTPYLLECPPSMFGHESIHRPTLRDPYATWCNEHMRGRWRAIYLRHRAFGYGPKPCVIEFMHEEDMVMFKLAFSEDMTPAPPPFRRRGFKKAA